MRYPKKEVNKNEGKMKKMFPVMLLWVMAYIPFKVL